MLRPTNKLTIHLVKGELGNHSDILSNDGQGLTSIPINQLGTFFFPDSESRKPDWVDRFFGRTLRDVNTILSSTAKGVYVTSIEYGEQTIYFAITFGYGRFLLDLSKLQARFGLRVMLNIVDADRIRKIDKKQLSSNPKDTSEQLSRAGQTAAFGVDVEQDMLRAVTGSPRATYTAFGTAPSGKDALAVSVRHDVGSVHDFLLTVYERYLSTDYRERFGWVDQIKEVQDRAVLAQLEQRLMHAVRGEGEDLIWMAVPEVVRWEAILGFVYPNDPNESNEYQDLSLTDYRSFFHGTELDDLEINDLRNERIRAISAENDRPLYRWKVYDCLYCEVQLNQPGPTYMLSNGSWYEVEEDFSQTVKQDFTNFRDNSIPIPLPAYDQATHQSEGGYNLAVANENQNWVCMDADNISYGGGHSRIEFCDILTDDNAIVHVKHYGGSSVLSHLFSQGSVSGELFKADEEFTQLVRNRLGNRHALGNASDYRIVYAIISDRQQDLEIPFFSKVNLRNHKRRLQALGYDVHIQKVDHQD